MAFEIIILRPRDETVIVKLAGDVDTQSSSKIRQEMTGLMESKTRYILVDLTDTEYLDSTALGLLVGGLRKMREKEGNLTLLCPSARIRRVFEITGLDRVFSIYKSQSEADHALSQL